MVCSECPYRLECLVLGWKPWIITLTGQYTPSDYELCYHQHVYYKNKGKMSHKKAKTCPVCNKIYIAHWARVCSSRCNYWYKKGQKHEYQVG